MKIPTVLFALDAGHGRGPNHDHGNAGGRGQRRETFEGIDKPEILQMAKEVSFILPHSPSRLQKVKPLPNEKKKKQRGKEGRKRRGRKQRGETTTSCSKTFYECLSNCLSTSENLSTLLSTTALSPTLVNSGYSLSITQVPPVVGNAICTEARTQQPRDKQRHKKRRGGGGYQTYENEDDPTKMVSFAINGTVAPANDNCISVGRTHPLLVQDTLKQQDGRIVVTKGPRSTRPDEVLDQEGDGVAHYTTTTFPIKFIAVPNDSGGGEVKPVVVRV
mmetsp:Transcript_26490/g.60864  ORF Transcript_26490/g.60864 Transcript_26490/m.60864 type:complete len:275 (-) Transcript_26490:88-912(-)